MIIYYCPGTGCSLSSQYSLQESVLKIIFSPLFPVLQYCVFPYRNCKVRCEISTGKYTVLLQTRSNFCGARSNCIFTRKEPAGAGGATGARYQLRRHPRDRKGVAPQSPLEESATTSATGPVRNWVTFGVAFGAGPRFWSDVFLELRMNSSQKSSKKWLQKKCHRHQTSDKQTDSGRS